MGGISADGEFEELFILRIAARHDLYVDVNPLSLPRQRRQKTADIFLSDVAAKLFSA